MATASRTQKSFKNAGVSFIFYIISLVLQFISRMVFIDYLGSDVLGLNSTATSLLGFLNMAELGIGAAIAFTLYKPIAEEDENSIKEIISVQGWFYKRVAAIVFVSGIILSCFFPLIFEKSNLPLWYAYATFGVLLFAALLSYQFNYKQILLSAHQLDYKITLAYKGPKVIKDLLQIIAIWQFPEYGYLLWVVFEGVGAIVCTVSLTHCINKEFPYIKNLNLDGGKLRKKYPVILTKIKQLLFHKVGAFVLFQAAPLVVYAFTTLTLVAIYGNYMLVVTGLSMLLSTAFNGLAGGIGNVVHTSTTDKILSVFREVFVFRFFLVAICCFAYIVCITPITILWVGEDYLLPNSSVYLIVAIMFMNMMRTSVELFIQASGLFQDIWAPILEATLNLGLSCLLAQLWGLNGILAGISISLLLIIAIWKPYFLFKQGFHQPIGYYFKLFFKSLFIGGSLGIFFLLLIDNYIIYYNFSSFEQLILSLTFVLIYTLILYLVLNYTETGMKLFTKRIKLFSHKLF